MQALDAKSKARSQRVRVRGVGGLAFASAALLLFATAALAVDAASLAQSLADPKRSEEDRARDAGRKPAEVIAFVGVEPGMRAIDLIAAGGYYTEVLSVAVGPQGKVYAQNTEFVLQVREGANEKAISTRLEGGRLPNVERFDRELAQLDLEPDSVDVAFTALNFHDIYNRGGNDAAVAFLKAVYRILKPGGVFGLIDHAGKAGADNEALHRIEESLVVAAIEASGFEIEATSDLLRNPLDDRSQNVFTPEIRGQTDRFVMRLRKPI